MNEKLSIGGGQEDSNLQERAEMAADNMLAKEVARERENDLFKFHGKSSRDLESDADAFLKAAGFDDLVGGDQ